MPVFSQNGKHILFIHIPKSAGSSLEKMASELGWEESFSERGKSLKNLAYYKSTPQHLHAEVLDKIFNLKKFDAVFTVTRNPFDRFKSEYYWQLSQGITTLDVPEWVDTVFDLYESNAYVYDNHIRPQVEFIPDGDNVQVLKLEEKGVEKARTIFTGLTENQGRKKSWGMQKKRFFSNSGRKEKQSVKDPAIEKLFLDHYGKIVEFYKDDYAI